MGFIYKNPSDRIDWFGRFTLMLDTVCLEAKEVVLLGDSISIFWGQILDGMSSIKNVNLHQLIDKPTQITTYSETLTDHNFVTTEQNIAEVSSPVCGCSDHFPICVKWFIYIYKVPKAAHKEIQLLLLLALVHSKLSQVYQYTDPDEAFEFWYKAFSLR